MSVRRLPAYTSAYVSHACLRANSRVCLTTPRSFAFSSLARFPDREHRGLLLGTEREPAVWS